MGEASVPFATQKSQVNSVSSCFQKPDSSRRAAQMASRQPVFSPPSWWPVSGSASPGGRTPVTNVKLGIVCWTSILNPKADNAQDQKASQLTEFTFGPCNALEDLFPRSTFPLIAPSHSSPHPLTPMLRRPPLPAGASGCSPPRQSHQELRCHLPSWSTSY